MANIGKLFCSLTLAVMSTPGITASGAEPASEQAELVSKMELMASDADAGGLALIAAKDVSVKHYSGDWSAPQVLELVRLRPGMEELAIRRLTTSCSCIRAALEKKAFSLGERILVEVRNIKKSPPDGAVFAVFLEVERPIRKIVEGRVFVKSEPEPLP